MAKKMSYDDLINEWRESNPDDFIADEYEEIDDQEDALLRFLNKTMIKPKKKEVEKLEEEEE